MGRTVSCSPGYAPEDEFDPKIDDFVANKRDYLHFDLLLSVESRESFTASHDDVCHRSFWPLIGYVATERRFKRQPNGKLAFFDKPRPIKFASHQDAALFQFYASDLSKDYEEYLKGSSFGHSVLAYRAGVGSNIEHAKSLFEEIRHRQRCTAIAVDITSFFDKIQHDVLYNALLKVRKVKRLNDADFAIFQRMTKYDWIESDEAQARLGAKYGRNGRICNGHEFRTLLRAKKPSLVRSNKNEFGIPQGTPLSGLYANISLIDFDQRMTAAMTAVGGSYRRYSDDIALVVPEEINAADAVQTIKDELATLGLELSDPKTHTSSFSVRAGQLISTSPFQYLGFTFDGRRTLVRHSSLNRYYSKMVRGVRAKVHAAKRNNVPKDEIFMRELFRKYTHFGQFRNFPRYVYRAAEVHNAPEMRKQIRRHMETFKRIVAKAVADIY